MPYHVQHPLLAGMLYYQNLSIYHKSYRGDKTEMKIKHLGIFGIVSLLSYMAMVVFSPLAYPGYDWMSMAVSDLSAEGAPSATLAARLNALFGPCALVSIMAVCVGVAGCRSKWLKLGIYCFAAMEWVCNVGYEMFPWVNGAAASNPQNIMHFMVTILVVVLSIAALLLIAIGSGGREWKPIRLWAVICLAAMLIGPAGTALLPQAVFGLFERVGTFSVVVFNAILGIYLLRGAYALEA